MDEQKQVISDFRKVHEDDTGTRVLADQLFELGLLGVITDDNQVALHNYAIRVIEKMGVITSGQKYQLALDIAKLLQAFRFKE